MSMIGNIGGQSGGGILTKSVLIVTAPTGSAVSVTNGPVTKTAAEKNGEWWFRNLDNGNWTITATKNTQKATASYSITQFGVYRKSITYFQATIHVTYPAGSTCTAADGATTLRAPDTSGSWACFVPNAGNWTITSTLGGQSDKKVVSISSDGQTASVALAYRITPEFTYTGSYQVVQDDDSPISDFANWKGNWKIRFLTSGTLTFTNLHGFNGLIDLFLVGGGGGGNPNYKQGSNYGGGGGGGYTKTIKKLVLTTGYAYPIDIGGGGAPGLSGGTTRAFSNDVNGGTTGKQGYTGGGDGGSGGGHYYVNGGSNGMDSGKWEGNQYVAGKGQGTTTREFGDSSGRLYAGGGNGGWSNAGGPDRTENDDPSIVQRGNAPENGGGGGTGGYDGANSGYYGGSGIVVIRNAR